jgi:hypothetical protein
VDDGPTCGDDYNAALEMRTTAGPSRHRAVSIKRRPVDGLVASTAGPCRVTAAAVSQAGDMANKYLVWAESVSVGGDAKAGG